MRRGRCVAAPRPASVATKRPSAPASTGSTCLRSRASDRSRSVLSTSRPHHSRSRPPGLNSPCTTRPEAASVRECGLDGLARQPNRFAHVRRREGTVCAREPLHEVAERIGDRLRAAPSAGLQGAGRPSASRYRAASSTATTRCSPAIGSSMARRAAMRSSTARMSECAPRARAISSRVRSPARSSMSCNPSTLRARRSSSSDWSCRSSASSTSGSSSSRSSASPSSSRSCA